MNELTTYKKSWESKAENKFLFIIYIVPPKYCAT